MKYVRLLIPLAVVSLLVLAGCGEEGGKGTADDPSAVSAPAEAVEKALETDAPAADDPAGAGSPAPSEGGGETMAATDPDKEQLRQRRFLLMTADGADFTAKEPRPELEFNEEFRIAGSICNRFAGQAELVDGVLKADKMAFTRMLCNDNDLNLLENSFSAMLEKGARVVFDGKVLTLSGDGRVLEYELKDLVQ